MSNDQEHYEERYRSLRRLGLPGWAGEGFFRSQSELGKAIEWLAEQNLLPPPDKPVLELGCGNGMAAYLLAKRGYAAEGIDLSKTAIQWAKERFAEAGLVGSFQQGNVCSMPCFEDSMFDLVFDGACFHCLIGAQREACLSEVKRILSPTGIFVLNSMCETPKRTQDLENYDAYRQVLLKDGVPYRTIRSSQNLID